jgi:DNA-binding MarR family transcriptional regulator
MFVYVQNWSEKKMDEFKRQLNEILVDTFKVILKIEEVSIKKIGVDLSVSEAHILEAAAKDGDNGQTISAIAESMGITLPSVTIAINKLAEKGYVRKVKNASDGRRVFVILTDQGKRMDAAHQYFHERMIRNLSADLNEEEKEVLYNAMVKLNRFFERKLLREKQ